MKRHRYLLGLTQIIFLYCLIPISSVQAQITSDQTLPTQVNTPDNSNFTITGGTQVGSNLFHSFSEFSVPIDGSAFFKNTLDIQNIIGRVTGTSPSNIEGLLKANGSANLFLLNPNGIIFGANASLNIGGSFVATTANSLKFADGTEFSTTESSASPVLTVSVPMGLQFSNSVGRIVNRSQASPDGTLNGSLKPVGLAVKPDQSLALVGGEVVLENGNLTAPSGRVEVGSVASNSLVKLEAVNQGLTLNYEGVQNFQDIQLSQEAIIDVTDLSPFFGTGDIGSGDVQIQGRNIRLTEGSQISSFTLGSVSAGTVAVTASESVELIGASANGSSSNLNTVTVGDGDAGDLIITTKRLSVRDGAGVFTNSFLPLIQGRSGNLTVNASESVEISGSSPQVGLSALTVETESAGNAGNLEITTPRLIIRDGGRVSAATSGTGQGGDLTINTDQLTLQDGGEITATSTQSGGGDININAQDIRLRSGSLISTSVFDSTGGGGNITINSDTFVALEDSDILANAFDGRGGNITIISPAFIADIFRDGQATAVGRNPGTLDRFRGNDRVDISVEAFGNSNSAVSGTLLLSSRSLDQNSLTPLSDTFISTEQVISDSCLTHRNKQQGSFTVTGTGGLPHTPYDPMDGRYSLTEVQGLTASSEHPLNSQPMGNNGTEIQGQSEGETLDPDSLNRSQSTLNHPTPISNSWKPGDPIQEAQGMMRTPDGRIIVGTSPELAAAVKAENLVCYANTELGEEWGVLSGE